MKTRTVTITAYAFSELSDKAKERAIEDYRNAVGYAWADDALASIKALAAHFGGKVKDYEIDWWSAARSHMTFDMPDADNVGNDNLPDSIQRSIGHSDATDDDVKAAYEKWLEAKIATLGDFNPITLKGHGSCVLTGYSADEDAIDGLRQAWHKGERDLDKLMQAAFDSWMEAAEADYEAQYEEATFAEHCDANEYEFDEDGKLGSTSVKLSA